MAAEALVLCILAANGPAYALDDQEAVKAAREGLTGRTSYPWYDKDRDQLRRVEVVPPEPPPEMRDWEWEWETMRRSGGGGFWTAVQILIWVALTALLVFAVFLLIRALLNSSAATGQQLAGRVRLGNEANRIENLSFQVDRPQGDLLSEARRYYQAGDFGRAIVYLFGYQLVHLDTNHLIQLARGKTNRQYLAEVRFRAQIAEILRDTMVAFEESFFGDHLPDRYRFESCWNRLSEFQREVKAAVETA